MSEPTPIARTLFAITLFAEDVPAMKQFYTNAFAIEPIFEDEHSVVFRFGENLINILMIEEASTLVDPIAVAPAGLGARAMYTITVEDVDAVYAEMTARGVTFLNGPQDRPWGPRTAALADPAGNVWELGS